MIFILKKSDKAIKISKIYLIKKNSKFKRKISKLHLKEMNIVIFYL